MMRRAIVDKKTGQILNCIVLHDEVDWVSPEGTYIVDAEIDGEPGGYYDEKTGFTKPTPPPADEKTEIDILRERIAALEVKTTNLETVKDG